MKAPMRGGRWGRGWTGEGKILKVTKEKLRSDMD